jgi:hypothetical protein
MNREAHVTDLNLTLAEPIIWLKTKESQAASTSDLYDYRRRGDHFRSTLLQQHHTNTLNNTNNMNANINNNNDASSLSSLQSGDDTTPVKRSSDSNISTNSNEPRTPGRQPSDDSNDNATEPLTPLSATPTQNDGSHTPTLASNDGNATISTNNNGTASTASTGHTVRMLRPSKQAAISGQTTSGIAAIGRRSSSARSLGSTLPLAVVCTLLLHLSIYLPHMKCTRDAFL